MKQKVYGLITIFISLLIFASLLMFNDKDEHAEDFEIIIVHNTSETTVSAIRVTSSERKLHTSRISTYTQTTTKIKKTSLTSKISETVSDIPEPESEPIIFPININTAGHDELMALDGIGENIASAIIEYRDTYGDFRNRDELKNVDGIGEAKLAGIYDFIFVENEIYISDDIPESCDESEVYEEPTEEYTEYYEEYSEPEQTTEVTENASENIMINLNTASKEDLIKLPYVDESIADDILKLRDTIQYFSHPYELLMVESLSQEQIAEIINFVTVE